MSRRSWRWRRSKWATRIRAATAGCPQVRPLLNDCIQYNSDGYSISRRTGLGCRRSGPGKGALRRNRRSRMGQTDPGRRIAVVVACKTCSIWHIVPRGTSMSGADPLSRRSAARLPGCDLNRETQLDEPAAARHKSTPPSAGDPPSPATSLFHVEHHRSTRSSRPSGQEVRRTDPTKNSE